MRDCLAPCAHACISRNTHIHVEDRGEGWVSSSATLHLILLRQGLFLDLELGSQQATVILFSLPTTAHGWVVTCMLGIWTVVFMLTQKALWPTQPQQLNFKCLGSVYVAGLLVPPFLNPGGTASFFQGSMPDSPCGSLCLSPHSVLFLSLPSSPFPTSLSAGSSSLTLLAL